VPDSSGERRQRTKGGFDKKRDAQGFLNEQLAGLADSNYIEPSRLTLGGYLTDYWLPAVKSSTRPSTWDSYRRTIEQHVIPALGGTHLQQLSAHQLDRFYADKLASGRVDGSRGLAPKTVRNMHNLLHKALKDAERKQLVGRNVASSADPPRQHHRTVDTAQTWTPAEIRVFLDAIRPHRLFAAYLLAVTTGMRRGEVLGLRWADVDFDRKRASIRQTVVSVAYEIQLSSPKTSKGRRAIALDDGTLAALKSHRSSQTRERLLVGSPYKDQDLVFAREDGAAVHPDFFSQTFERTVAKVDVPRIRLHDLRHTHATLGLAAGIPPKVMSERLGHATVAFTQDVYVHAIPEREEEAAQTIANLIL